ncbi:unnamed protein product [Durusdinium trenchii]|uniref:Uncharacterized protein n=1 Tax=Durusdinium trenchii TaxID=1381693 RepID=A0ABP0HXV5_9DINO
MGSGASTKSSGTGSPSKPRRTPHSGSRLHQMRQRVRATQRLDPVIPSEQERWTTSKTKTLSLIEEGQEEEDCLKDLGDPSNREASTDSLQWTHPFAPMDLQATHC